jgi:predicted dehydrogenase
VVHITRGLLKALLELADDRDPSSVTVALAVTPAEEFASELPPDTPVFTDMYLPNTGNSVTAVFGMDISTPNAAGRFISHPDGTLELTKADDLHEVVFVAVPPYEEASVAAFGRSGEGRPIEIVDAEPPDGQLDDYSR